MGENLAFVHKCVLLRESHFHCLGYQWRT